MAVLVLGALVRGGAALGFWSTPDFRGAAAHERECLDGAGSASSKLAQLGKVDASAAGYLTEDRLRTAMKPFCRRAARDSRIGSSNSETRMRAMSELIRSHPDVWGPMCKLGLEAEFANRSDLRFMTAHERRRFQRRECKYRRAYMAEDSLAVDLGRIAADHPEHYVPLCASQLLASLTAVRSFARYTNADLRTISRRSCLEALRTRVIDATGPGGFSTCRVDRARWNALIRRVAQSV